MGGYEADAFTNFGSAIGIRPTPLLTPVGLERHLRLHPAQPQPTHCQTQKRHPVQRGHLTAERQQAQPRATFQNSPLIARQAVLAQMIPAFRAERALVVDVFHIGLNKRERFLRFPRPVRRIEASARFAGTAGCRCVAFEDVSDGIGGEVNAVLGEVAGKPLASVVGFLVALEDALL